MQRDAMMELASVKSDLRNFADGFARRPQGLRDFKLLSLSRGDLARYDEGRQVRHNLSSIHPAHCPPTLNHLSIPTARSEFNPLRHCCRIQLQFCWSKTPSAKPIVEVYLRPPFPTILLLLLILVILLIFQLFNILPQDLVNLSIIPLDRHTPIRVSKVRRLGHPTEQAYLDNSCDHLQRLEKLRR